MDVFKRFVEKVETQLECRVKVLRTDHGRENGREYLSDIFKVLCEENIIRKLLTFLELLDKMQESYIT